MRIKCKSRTRLFAQDVAQRRSRLQIDSGRVKVADGNGDEPRKRFLFRLKTNKSNRLLLKTAHKIDGEERRVEQVQK
jgi:hypothetical protein